MILVDDRVGSRELVHFLPRQMAMLNRLTFGDAMWLGNGPDDIPVHVGVEIKAIGDLLKSIVDGRFAGHQLPGLLRDYHVIYLIVEGKFRPEPETGLLQVPWNGTWVPADFGAKRWTHRDLWGFLTTMEIHYGLKLRRTYDRRETARVIQDLHHWWTAKAFGEHKSGCAFDTSGEPTLLPATLLRRIAAQFDGIGWKRAQAVEQHFTSVIDMILAPEGEWRKISGVGKKIAAEIVAAIWRQKRVVHPGCE
jgi:ERCC4-type nuclease